MAARGMYETVKQAIQDVVAPDLERIKGEITSLRAEIGAVRSELLERIAGETSTLRAEMGLVRGEVGSLRSELSGEIATVRSELSAEIATVRSEFSGEFATVRAEVKAVDSRVGNLEKRVDDGFRAVNDRIDALKERAEQTNRRLDEARDIRERLAALEVKVAALGCPCRSREFLPSITVRPSPERTRFVGVCSVFAVTSARRELPQTPKLVRGGQTGSQAAGTSSTSRRGHPRS